MDANLYETTCCIGTLVGTPQLTIKHSLEYTFDYVTTNYITHPRHHCNDNIDLTRQLFVSAVLFPYSYVHNYFI